MAGLFTVSNDHRGFGHLVFRNVLKIANRFFP